jgi:hypothetical protein
MADLTDTEGFEMPVGDDGNALFHATFHVNVDWEDPDFKPTDAEVTVYIPMYCTGSDVDSDYFEYDSCGILGASLDEMLSDFIDYSCDNKKEALFLRDKFIELAERLDKASKEFDE